MKILVVGGAGYIGSHVCVELLAAGHDVVVLDNFSNSQRETIFDIAEIADKHFSIYEGDILNPSDLDRVFNSEHINAVIHLAGLKSIYQSNEDPMGYFNTNVLGTIKLIDAMKRARVFHLVFSSSATVYGQDQAMPFCEDLEHGEASSIYAKSKLAIEKMLQTLGQNKNWSIAALRYFNPIGAHPSGLIGDNPTTSYGNLMPALLDVAIGRSENLSLYGDDYATGDGTAVRDFVHVVDLAKAHVSALNNRIKNPGYRCWNVGTGSGISILSLIKRFEHCTGIAIPFLIYPRRDGDYSQSYADVRRAKIELNWTPTYGIDDMLIHSWKNKLMFCAKQV